MMSRLGVVRLQSGHTDKFQAFFWGRTLTYDCRDFIMDFPMTVRTKKNTLVQLDYQAFPRAHTRTHTEVFETRIKVMEDERAG